MNFIWEISENRYFWSVKYYLWTVCSPKEHAGNLWAGLAEGQGCFGGGRGSTMSPRRVVNGTRQSCGMMAFGGHDGERCHNSTWCSRAALAGSRCVYKKWGNHSCWQPWEIPPWLSLWIAGTAAENSGFKKKEKIKFQRETPCEGDLTSVSQ